MKIVFGDAYAEERLCLDAKEIDRLEQAAEAHGRRGASSKKHNGVVPIRPGDTQLWGALSKFEAPVGWTAVTVVAHVPSGSRLVGVLSPDAATLCILCATNYHYKRHEPTQGNAIDTP